MRDILQEILCYLNWIYYFIYGFYTCHGDTDRLISWVPAIKVSTICIIIFVYIMETVSPNFIGHDYFTAKYVVSLVVMIMIGSYQLWCGVLFISVSKVTSQAAWKYILRNKG